MRLVQHIKNKCRRDVFNAHMSGERNMELRVDNFDVEAGDIITFVEVDDAGEKTGRTFTRKVAQLERAKDIQCATGEVDHYGVVAMSFRDPEFNTLRMAFSSHFLLGVVIECRKEEWRPVGHAQVWPLLMAPDVMSAGVINLLRPEKWPEGIYTLHLMLSYAPSPGDDQQLVLDIANTFILVFCLSPDGKMMGVEVEINALMVGKTIGVFDGSSVTPSAPTDVLEYFEFGTKDGPSSLSVISGELSEDQFREVVRQTRPWSEGG